MINSYIWALRRWLVVIVACVASTTLFAQSQGGASLDVLLQQSEQILRQIDQRAAPAAWESASVVMRESTKQDDFVARVADDRAGLGAIRTRIWRMVARASYADGNPQRMPPGEYVNINFLAADGSGQLLQELISFRWEDEKQWRMTGYVSRKVTAR